MYESYGTYVNDGYVHNHDYDDDTDDGTDDEADDDTDDDTDHKKDSYTAVGAAPDAGARQNNFLGGGLTKTAAPNLFL